MVWLRFLSLVPRLKALTIKLGLIRGGAPPQTDFGGGIALCPHRMRRSPIVRQGEVWHSFKCQLYFQVWRWKTILDK